MLLPAWIWAVLLAASLATSAISAVLGMAGGVSLLAVMAALLPAETVVPLHGVVQLGSNFTRTLAFLRHVRWHLFVPYGIALAAGVAAATLLWEGSLRWFRPGIGVFILLFLVWRRKAPVLRNLPGWIYLPLGAAAGFLTLFVGATGPFIAPFFLRDDLSKEQVVATKAACQSWGHLLKLPAFLSVGFDYVPHLPLLAALLAAVVVGTLAGKRFLRRLPEETFKRLFEAVLAALAALLIVQGVAELSEAT